MTKKFTERAVAIAAAAAALLFGAGVSEQASAEGIYTCECRGADGQLKWVDTFHNTVLTAGKNDALDKYFAGSSYTAAWFMGLISTVSYTAISAADTAASHAGWTESVVYSNSTRPAAAWASASAGSKALSSGCVFNINASDTIKGAFMITVSTKSGTTGIMYSAGLFTGGDKPVTNGDTLTVTYSASL